MNARCPSRIALLAGVCLALAPVAVPAQTREELLQFAKTLHKWSCPLITDPAGNAGGNPVDFTTLYAGNDVTYVYFLVEFANAASDNQLSVIYLDTDLDQTTGCGLSIPRLKGPEYGVLFLDPSIADPFVTDHRDCKGGSDDFPDRGGVSMAISGRFIVLSVPIATLQILTPDVDGFLVQFGGGGNFGPAAYKLR